MLKNTTPYQRSLYKDFLVAEFRVSTTFGDSSQLIQVFTYPDGRIQKIRSVEFVKILEMATYLAAHLLPMLCLGVKTFYSSLFLIYIFISRLPNTYHLIDLFNY